MLFRRILNWIGLPFFNIYRWVDYPYLARITQQLMSFVQNTFILRPQTDHATFTEVVSQLNLTEHDLIKRAQYFTQLLRFWLILCIMVLIYACYLALQRVWLGVISTLMLDLMIVCQVFRYHFWLFQLKRKKLGCSFNEWIAAYVGKFGK